MDFSPVYNYDLYFWIQDNYNALHISAMYSREDVVKSLLSKRGVDPYATGGVSNKATPQDDQLMTENMND